MRRSLYRHRPVLHGGTSPSGPRKPRGPERRRCPRAAAALARLASPRPMDSLCGTPIARLQARETARPERVRRGSWVLAKRASIWGRALAHRGCARAFIKYKTAPKTARRIVAALHAACQAPFSTSLHLLGGLRRGLPSASHREGPAQVARPVPLLCWRHLATASPNRSSGHLRPTPGPALRGVFSSAPTARIDRWK